MSEGESRAPPRLHWMPSGITLCQLFVASFLVVLGVVAFFNQFNEHILSVKTWRALVLIAFLASSLGTLWFGVRVLQCTAGNRTVASAPASAEPSSKKPPSSRRSSGNSVTLSVLAAQGQAAKALNDAASSDLAECAHTYRHCVAAFLFYFGSMAMELVALVFAEVLYRRGNVDRLTPFGATVTQVEQYKYQFLLVRQLDIVVVAWLFALSVFVARSRLCAK